MMKLTEKQKLKIASKIPSEYDYMDELSMNGWTWEFLRRSKGYREDFSKLEKKVETGAWDDEDDNGPSKPEYMDTRIAMLPLPIVKGDSGNYLKVNPPFKGSYAMQRRYDITTEYHIPRPSIRYIDLAPPPFVLPKKKDYVIYTSIESLMWQLNLERDDEDVFYIEVGKHAKITDLKENLLRDISKFLKKKTPRIRQSKWKFYMIVYDLKQKYGNGISYNQISDILIDAYGQQNPKYLDEMRNINHWYEYAESLINDGYKKYLKPSSIRPRTKQTPSKNK